MCQLWYPKTKNLNTRLLNDCHILISKPPRKYQVRLWFNHPKSCFFFKRRFRWSPGRRPSSLGLSGRFPEVLKLRIQFMGNEGWRYIISHQKIMAICQCVTVKSCHPIRICVDLFHFSWCFKKCKAFQVPDEASRLADQGVPQELFNFWPPTYGKKTMSFHLLKSGFNLWGKKETTRQFHPVWRFDDIFSKTSP